MATAKKTTAAKRPYNRRKKPVEAVENTVVKPGDNPGYQPPTPQQMLEATDIIDLRSTPAQAKYLLTMHLEQGGYLFAHDTKNDMTADFPEIARAQGYRLNHKNKLVTIVNGADILMSPAVVQLANLEAHLQVYLTPPAPVAPNTIVANGQLYVKAS